MDHDGRRRESRRSSISFVRYAATQALMEGQSHGQNFVSPSGDLAKIRRSVKRIRRTLTQFASAQGSEPLELRSYFGQLDKPEDGCVSIHALQRVSLRDREDRVDP